MPAKNTPLGRAFSAVPGSSCASRVARKPSHTEAITSHTSRRAALNSTAKANEPASRVSQVIHAGSTAPTLGIGCHPSRFTTWAAATAPKVSFNSTVSAPAKRAVPDTSCRLVSSDTAVVRLRPGISTIKAAMMTFCSDSVARKADTASWASDQRGRPWLSSVSTPIIMPRLAAATRSAQPVLRISPVTEAEASPKLRIAQGRAKRLPGRSSARIATSPSAMSRRPASTSSAMPSAAASRPRFSSPGSSRITRVSG